MVYETILDEAKWLTSEDRQDKYGPPPVNFASIAAYWRVYIQSEFHVDVPLKPEHAACMMTLLKIAREHSHHRRDNLVDGAGYLRIASMLKGDEDSGGMD